MESTRLRLSKYSLAYRARLADGWNHLWKFLIQEGSSWKSFLKGTPNEIDECLEKYVIACHNKNKKGRALRRAKHAVLLVQIIRPDLKRNIKRSWDTLKSWEESQPSQLRRPLPLSILIGMICQARVEAFLCADQPKAAEKWWTFSVLIGLGFFGLLRPSELLSLCKKHIDLANSLTFAVPAVTVAIERPKNFRQLGTTQFVSVRQADVCNWLAWLCADKSHSDLLWSYSQGEFRRLFRVISSRLSIPVGTYSPGSLRAGGATYFFEEVPDVGRLRLNDRWASIQSLEHYIQVGKGQQLLQCMSGHSIKKIQTLLKKGSFLLSLPAAKASVVAPQNLLHTVRPRIHGQEFGSFCRQWARLGKEDAQSGDSRWILERSPIR